MASNPLPADTEALLKHLSEAYPLRAPKPEWSERELWMKAGEWRLIEALGRKWAAQMESAGV